MFKTQEVLEIVDVVGAETAKKKSTRRPHKWKAEEMITEEAVELLKD